MFALAASHAQFNNDFYVMAATVIPVFFIALLIEETFATALVVRAIAHDIKSMEEFRKALEAAESAPPPPALWTFNIPLPFGKRLPIQVGGAPSGPQRSASNLWLLPAVVLTAVAAGEVIAVFALSNQHATGFEHVIVLIDLVGLPVLLALSGFASAWSRARKAAEIGAAPASEAAPD